MSAKIDTTPDYPEQPASLVEAAERDLPAVLQEMPNENGNGAGDPGHGHRVVLAGKLVEALAGQKGHGKAPAAWAVHRLAERGLLRCEVAREFYPRVVGQRQVPGRVMFGVQRYREEPVYGTKEVQLADPAAGPVPYRMLLVYSTDQLWAWWRSITDVPPTNPDMDSILRQVQAKREQGEAAERQYQDQLARLSRLRDAFQAAASFAWQDHTAALGREPTREEFYRAWAERLAAFGRAIGDHDLMGWLEREYNPDTPAGQWTRGVLLRASRTPEDVTGLQELLKQSGDEQELHALRHRLRDAGEQLLKEASRAMTTNEDADPLTRELAALREECRTRRLALDIWNVTQHGDPNFPQGCVGELWQKVRSVAYGAAQKAPPREPDQVPDVAAAHRALDEVMRWCEEQEPATAEVDYPHEFPLVAERDPQRARTAATGRTLDFRQSEMVQLGFPWDWWVPLELARRWQSRPYPVNRSRDAVSQWRAYMEECVSCANISRVMRTVAGKLQEDMAGDLALLQQFDATLVAGTPSASEPADKQAAEDLPDYKADDQPWFTPLPVPKELRSDELTGLADEIDLVVITATDPEVEAVLRRLEPYPRRRAILKGFVEQETYYLGRFGSCLAAVTKCRMGSLDSGAATLATQHAQRIWRPRAVVMVGIALGKDQAKQKMADVLVASQVISYEPQRVGEKQVVPRGPITPASTTLLNRFENVPHWSFSRPDGSKCERHVGPLLSGEKLVDDPTFKAELFDRYPQAIGGEMEGVGLAAVAVRHGVPWILVKAICDWADGKKHKKHQPLAAAAAVSLAHHVLSQADVLHGLVKPSQP